MLDMSPTQVKIEPQVATSPGNAFFTKAKYTSCRKSLVHKTIKVPIYGYIYMAKNSQMKTSPGGEKVLCVEVTTHMIGPSFFTQVTRY